MEQEDEKQLEKCWTPAKTQEKLENLRTSDLPCIQLFSYRK